MDLEIRQRGLWSMEEDNGVTNGSPWSVVSVIEPLDVHEDVAPESVFTDPRGAYFEIRFVEMTLEFRECVFRNLSFFETTQVHVDPSQETKHT
jgi:hypothetical protein